MAPSMLSDISFDQEDGNLFLVEDARLRADALKYSVLPRLNVIINSAIAVVREVYGIDAFADSIVSRYPNFRPKRPNELTLKYADAAVALGGQRRPKWVGFSRDDGKPVQIVPFRYGFTLSPTGVNIRLENGWLKGLDDASFRVLLEFHIKYEQSISPLCFEAQMRPAVIWADDLSILASLRKQYRYRIDYGLYDNWFVGNVHAYPVSSVALAGLVTQFVTFFPVYDCYVQMAKGLPLRLGSLIAKLSDWIRNSEDKCDDGSQLDKSQARREASSRAAIAAESRVRVMPGLRWQVFAHDKWKCVSCGGHALSGAILHVDHIQPRSRGGVDGPENYQTLCSVCNIGKGNRDATDLRGKR